MAGTANLARSNVDFPLSIGPVLEALEEQVVMLRLLSEMAQDPRGVTVSIGRENPYDGLAEASVVATGYGPDATAKVGVLGPTRMDYPTTMAAVRAVARYLSRILGRLDRAPAARHSHATSQPTRSTTDAGQQEEIRHFEQPLRRSWSLPRRDGGGDQEGLPQAGPHPPPGREPGRGRARSASRPSPTPTRCSPIRRSAGSTTPPAMRTAPTTASAAAATPGQGFAFQDIFETFFGGGGGAGRVRPRGSAAARTRSSASGSTCATPSSASTRRSRWTPPSSAPPATAPAAARAPTRGPATSAAAAARSSGPCAPSWARS